MYFDVSQMETWTCTHCGREVFWEENDGVYLHAEYGKWPGDNGYWCYENDRELSAEPVTW